MKKLFTLLAACLVMAIPASAAVYQKTLLSETFALCSEGSIETPTTENIYDASTGEILSQYVTTPGWKFVTQSGTPAAGFLTQGGGAAYVEGGGFATMLQTPTLKWAGSTDGMVTVTFEVLTSNAENTDMMFEMRTSSTGKKQKMVTLVPGEWQTISLTYNAPGDEGNVRIDGGDDPYFIRNLVVSSSVDAPDYSGSYDFTSTLTTINEKSWTAFAIADFTFSVEPNTGEDAATYPYVLKNFLPYNMPTGKAPHDLKAFYGGDGSLVIQGGCDPANYVYGESNESAHLCIFDTNGYAGGNGQIVISKTEKGYTIANGFVAVQHSKYDFGIMSDDTPTDIVRYTNVSITRAKPAGIDEVLGTYYVKGTRNAESLVDLSSPKSWKFVDGEGSFTVELNEGDDAVQYPLIIKGFLGTPEFAVKDLKAHYADGVISIPQGKNVALYGSNPRAFLCTTTVETKDYTATEEDIVLVAGADGNLVPSATVAVGYHEDGIPFLGIPDTDEVAYIYSSLVISKEPFEPEAEIVWTVEAPQTSTLSEPVLYRIHNLGANDGSYAGNDVYVQTQESGIRFCDADGTADEFVFIDGGDNTVYIYDNTTKKYISWITDAEGSCNWSGGMAVNLVTRVEAVAEQASAKTWVIVDDENTEGRYDIKPSANSNNSWSFYGGIDQTSVVLNLEVKTNRNAKWMFERKGEKQIEPEPTGVAEGEFYVKNVGNGKYFGFVGTTLSDGNFGPVEEANKLVCTVTQPEDGTFNIQLQGFNYVSCGSNGGFSNNKATNALKLFKVNGTQAEEVNTIEEGAEYLIVGTKNDVTYAISNGTNGKTGADLRTAGIAVSIVKGHILDIYNSCKWTFEPYVNTDTREAINAVYIKNGEGKFFAIGGEGDDVNLLDEGQTWNIAPVEGHANAYTLENAELDAVKRFINSGSYGYTSKGEDYNARDIFFYELTNATTGECTLVEQPVLGKTYAMVIQNVTTNYAGFYVIYSGLAKDKVNRGDVINLNVDELPTTLTIDATLSSSNGTITPAKALWTLTDNYEVNYRPALEEAITALEEALEEHLLDEPLVTIKGEGLITSADQFASEYSDADEGKDFGALIDEDPSTFWHTDWHGTAPEGAHSFDVSLPENQLTSFVVTYTGRLNQNNCSPIAMTVYGKNEGEEWEVITTLTQEDGLGAYAGEGRTADVDALTGGFTFQTEKAYTNFRFEAHAVWGDAGLWTDIVGFEMPEGAQVNEEKCFNYSEFQMYEAAVYKYDIDPEMAKTLENAIVEGKGILNEDVADDHEILKTATDALNAFLEALETAPKVVFTYTIAIEGAAEGGAIIDGEECTDGMEITGLEELTAEDVTPVQVEGYEAVVTVENGVITVTYTQTTGINAIASDAQRAAIFNLQGQRLNAASRGVSIVGGKKVLVK